jgi:hypothetical protein
VSKNKKPKMDEATRAIQVALHLESEKQRNLDDRAYDDLVTSMTQKQLMGELKREARNKSNSMLDQAHYVVGAIILESTHTLENPMGKLECYPR